MTEAYDYFRRGRRLSEADVERLERKLERKPSDMKTRCQLIGYYSRQRFDDNSKEKFEQHALWVIENHWKHEAVQFLDLNRFMNSNAYETAKHLWLSHVALDDTDVVVLDGAARFFRLNDKKLAQDLLRKAQQLEPENPHWARRLARVYNSDNQYQNALAEQERACMLSESSESSDLEDLPELALRANDVQKAKKYANQLIEIAKTQDGVEKAVLLYKAHIVLALIFSRQGLMVKAKENLESAYGTTKEFSIPFHWTRGETAELLQTFLDSNESESVVAFLNHCDAERPCIKRWINEIEDGIVPDLRNDRPYRFEDGYVSMERFWFNKNRSETTSPSETPTGEQLRHTTLWQFLIARIEQTKPDDWREIIDALMVVPLKTQRHMTRQFNYSFNDDKNVAMTATGVVFDTENETRRRIVCIFHKNLPERTLREAMPGSLGILRDPASCVYSGSTNRDDEINTPVEIHKGPYIVIAIDVVGETNVCALLELDPEAQRETIDPESIR